MYTSAASYRLTCAATTPFGTAVAIGKEVTPSATKSVLSSLWARGESSSLRTLRSAGERDATTNAEAFGAGFVAPVSPVGAVFTADCATVDGVIRGEETAAADDDEEGAAAAAGAAAAGTSPFSGLSGAVS